MKKEKIKKVKKPVIKKLIKELDCVFSLYIRKRDHNICYTCGKQMDLKHSQNGHFVSRTYLTLRWNEKNCHCQCMRCNVFLHGNMAEYSQRLELDYGYGIIQELNRLKQEKTKFSAEKLTELIKHYTNLIN